MPKLSDSINHLSYVDDAIIFAAGKKTRQLVMQTLKEYENQSGQKINKDKSSLFFTRLQD